MESLNKHNIIDLRLKAGEFAYANTRHDSTNGISQGHRYANIHHFF
ncbi:MAG: hypothetical protein K2N75_07475 [Helicobacter sp.]|nr:hypothetical protein [Helicobacter sp.]MDE5926137.1 hypothetical protein [Helicobacter sp.]MDE7175862.1 hypothetical protein [Helicobacter sp.]